MRPYRAIPTKGGKDFVYGWYMEIEGIHYIVDNTVSHTWLEEDCYEVQGLIVVIPETVGQQIGLKDKNGKEIYEGDIVRVIGSRKDKEIISAVTFDYLGACIVDKLDGDGRKIKVRLDMISDPRKPLEVEIIGSIHTTPELLEKPK